MLSERSVLAALSAATLAPLASLLPLAAAAPPEAAERAPGPDDKALYLEHCAQCHGESGDGQGTQELERPARSFLDGGFSYGNTQNAVLRSVLHGIPGTPMPAFGETLNEEQLAAVADYVIALGPPGTIVEPGASVLTVEDRPVVVHGMLPPAREGAKREPRGLLVGFPNGTSFQYRQTDGELLAVRQGDFVDRRDWRDRGGRSLRPLGTVVWTPEKNAAGELTAGSKDEAVSKRIVKTVVRERRVWLHFDLVDAEGVIRGGGQEILDFLMVNDIPVPIRAVAVASGTDSIAFRPIPSEPLEALVTDLDDVQISNEVAHKDPTVFVVAKAGEGVFAIAEGNIPNLRIYVHAAEWSGALRDAIAASLSQQN